MYLCTALNLGCWSYIRDVRGVNGVPHNLTKSACQAACVDDNVCVGIDFYLGVKDVKKFSWKGYNRCWLLTSNDTEPVPKLPTAQRRIIHSQVNRACISKLSKFFSFTRIHFDSVCITLFI